MIISVQVSYWFASGVEFLFGLQEWYCADFSYDGSRHVLRGCPCHCVYSGYPVAECGIMLYLNAASRNASSQYGVGSSA